VIDVLPSGRDWCGPAHEGAQSSIKGRPRDSVVISTKSHATSTQAILANLDNSLRQLDTDYVDIFHLHGLGPAAYDKAMAEYVPALLREKAKGKLRHLAVSETGPRDRHPCPPMEGAVCAGLR
jgi:aryl-alcohol dehydrogenase-like predicted oxidoreductase